MKIWKIAALGLVAMAPGVVAIADGHANPKVVEDAIKARKAHMQLYAFNLGILGEMAKGNVPYDADVASAAANDLAAVAALSQRSYWVPGSDKDSVKGTRALAAIWAADSKAGAQSKALIDATAAMSEAAGKDLAALQASIGAVGDACSACHKANRGPKT